MTKLYNTNKKSRNSHDGSKYHEPHTIAAPLGTIGGAVKEVNAGLSLKRPACFQKHVDAFRAHRRTLIKRGLIPVGNRELIDPKDNMVLVLTRPGKFGKRLKGGKNRNTARRYGIII